MLESVGMAVGLPPLAGYSVTAGPGSARVMTSSEPYHASAVKLASAANDDGGVWGVSWTVDSEICGLGPCCPEMAPKVSVLLFVGPFSTIATRTPSGATLSSVNGGVARAESRDTVTGTGVL